MVSELEMKLESQAALGEMMSQFGGCVSNRMPELYPCAIKDRRRSGWLEAQSCALSLMLRDFLYIGLWSDSGCILFKEFSDYCIRMGLKARNSNMPQHTMVFFRLLTQLWNKKPRPFP